MLLVIHATRPTIRSMQTVRVMQASGSTNNTTNGTNGPDVKCEEGWNLTNETDTSEAKCMRTGAEYCGGDKYCTKGLSCCDKGQVCCQEGDSCSIASDVPGSSAKSGTSRCCADGYKINPFHSTDTGVGCVPSTLTTSQICDGRATY